MIKDLCIILGKKLIKDDKERAAIKVRNDTYLNKVTSAASLRLWTSRGKITPYTFSENRDSNKMHEKVL